MRTPIPTHLILGFLGVGKTTAILDLLRRKPAHETWAVLVNEFGEVGIDGALLTEQGAVVREVPGGCMCCVAGLPMQVGLNMLIARAKPDRLLIEPTGLGHPAQVLEILTGPFYRDTLQLQATLCLVDPRRLDDPKTMSSHLFHDQVAAADVLIANKTDLCTAPQLSHFDAWASRLQPAKRAVAHTTQGHLDLEWLTWPSAAHRPPAHPDHPAPAPAAGLVNLRPSLDVQPWQRFSNAGLGHHSLGWQWHPDLCFDHDRLLTFCHGIDAVRLKGVMHTERGWLTLNLADGILSLRPLDEPQPDSRLEILCTEPPDADRLDALLHRVCREA